MGCGSSKTLKDQELLLIKKNSVGEIDRAEADDQTALLPKNNNNHCEEQTTTEITANNSNTEIKEVPDDINITADLANEAETKRSNVQNNCKNEQEGIETVSDEKPASSKKQTIEDLNQEEADILTQRITMSEDTDANHEASQKPNDIPAAELVKESLDPRLESFVTNGENILDQLNNMPMTLDDMPSNYQIAKAFGQLYHKARYGISKSLCRKFLDKMTDKGLIPCFVNAFQKIQRQWPHVFNEIAYQDEVTAYCIELKMNRKSCKREGDNLSFLLGPGLAWPLIPLQRMISAAIQHALN